MSAPAQTQHTLRDAMRATAARMGHLTDAHVQSLTDQYKAGQITLDARSLRDALHKSPELLVSLNKAGLSLDEMDKLVADDGIRGLSSFSALVVVTTAATGPSPMIEGYEAALEKEAQKLQVLSQIYTHEGRTISEAEFINGISAVDDFVGKSHLVFGRDHLDYGNTLVGRLKNGGLATPNFNVVDALINKSVFAGRDNYQGPLTVVTHPTEGNFDANIYNTFPDYSPFNPQASFDYVVQPGDTLTSVAARLQPALGAESPEEARKRIALLNGSADIAAYSRTLQSGQTMKIPITPAVEVAHHMVEEGETLSSLTARYNTSSKGPQAVSLVAHFNNLQNPDLLHPGQILNIPIKGDGADLSVVSAPQVQDGKATTLYVTESYGIHHFATYGTAVQYATSAFPDYKNSGLDIKPLNPDSTEDMSETVDQLIRKGGTTDAVFSISLSNRPSFDQITPEGHRLDQQALEYYGHHAPNILISAGNNFQENKEQYSVLTQIGSRNAFVVGATHQGDDGASYIAPYSSPGADFTSTPLIPINGQKVFGTSFSTPSMATSAAQMNTWYGNRLSFEEIMYTGMLSTKIDIGDCKVEHKAECTATTVDKGVFVTNGAGLPHHARAGAGEIDLHRWKENLDRLASLKQTHNLQNKPITLDVRADDLLNKQGPDKNGIYHYDVQVPAAIMVGKIIAEAGPETRVQIESPSGYKSYIGASVKTSSHAATSAFAFEEYKAGDTLRIASSKPLGDQFRLTMQGQEPGSALDILRDTLQAEGRMLKPHSTYENGTLADKKYIQGYFTQPMPEQQLANPEKQLAAITAPSSLAASP